MNVYQKSFIPINLILVLLLTVGLHKEGVSPLPYTQLIVLYLFITTIGIVVMQNKYLDMDDDYDE